MASFTCSVCGKTHDEFDMALIYRRPMHYYSIPERERNQRIKINEDLCSIDNQLYFIRGVLEMPIKGTNEILEWGLWAMVEPTYFFVYVDLWDADIDESAEPFKGMISGSPRFYPDSNMTEVTVHLRSNGKRPLFKVISEQDQMGIDQREGISMETVHYFIDNFMPKHPS